METMRKSSMVALLAAAALTLAGCGGTATEGGTNLPAVSSASSPATGDATSPTQAPPSSIPPATPTATESSGDPTVLPTLASVTVVYVAVGDGGVSGPEFGCGDSTVGVTSPAISFTDPVEAALRTLLENHDMEVGESGLRNALWQSDLTVKSVDRSGNPIIVDLEGTLQLAGECDIPRAQLQLLLTAQQAAGFPIEITINGIPMAEALSLK